MAGSSEEQVITDIGRRGEGVGGEMPAMGSWSDDEYVRCQSGKISPSGRVGKRLSSLSLLFWTRREGG